MKAFSSLICMLVFGNVFADISISDVKVFSGWPWKDVIIGYKISGRTDKKVQLSITAEDKVANMTYECRTLQGVSLAEGSHVIKWNAQEDGVKLSSSHVVFSARIETVPLYCVVNLLPIGQLGGISRVTYLDAMPRVASALNECQQSKILLRRIEPGVLQMQGKQVTLTKPFYIGVYEVTQSQWKHVMGSNPSKYRDDLIPTYGVNFPVESVSYGEVRGRGAGAGWPKSYGVDSDSFLGRLQEMTNLDFDLPTEAQWEYACRSGTTGDYAGTGILSQMGYCGGVTAHVKVGSYQANQWGLYDMHGNVGEWCRDWYGEILNDASDPVGPLYPKFTWSRVVRGGDWKSDACKCTSWYREGDLESLRSRQIGFRLALTIQDNCKICYDANGGRCSVSRQFVTPGSTLADLPMAVRAGYSFEGWYTAADGGLKVTESTVCKEGTTLYAHWKYERKQKLYCIIDLSSGTGGENSPVSYLDSMPDGGWTDEYKTTKMVLRRIEPGAFWMLDHYGLGQYGLTEHGVNVLLTKPFYIGVFKVTRKQYTLLRGVGISDVLPHEQERLGDKGVHKLSYDAIRGKFEGACWPKSSAVDAESCIGCLRAKTGLMIDLPTEAQWEYACRAGTTGDYAGTGNPDDMCSEFGYDTSATLEPLPAGVSIPNQWGLYEMHASEWEWCLDWYRKEIEAATDPVGPRLGTDRVLRGGNECSSSSRLLGEPQSDIGGFRIAFTVQGE